MTGDSPLVDVQNTQRTHVISREQLDSLPTARNYSGVAALLPGVRMTNTDVGGNQQIGQIYMISHGSRRTDPTNRDLRADVARQRFREGLFYRLHVVD